ncbi:MAG: VOC family protein, partial [Sandaracinaceae bacterium]
MSNTGRWVWDELLTQNQSNASEFYRGLFGWTANEMDMGEMGTYLMMKVGERSVGGMMQSPSPEVPQNWLSYVCVDDVDASAKQIETLGGTLINKPCSIPNIGRMVMATDPTGA